MRETHLSWLILTGPFAYKIKKSVDLGFVDASTLERRRWLCEEELRLNRRLAADLYLDVIRITRCEGETRVGGTGEIVEYAVRMRQFVSSDELSALLDRDAVGASELIELAHRIAQFHDEAPRAPPSRDGPHTGDLREAALGTFGRLQSHLGGAPRPPELDVLVAWATRYLEQELPGLRERELSGHIRECHGDLHARNVVRWRAALLPFDCLEFDPRLRWIDTMSDVAFMVMDLQAHGRKDLASAFLNAYLEHTGDYEGTRHLAFYEIYRALVRAMVDGLSAEADCGQRRFFQNRLRTRIGTAAALLDRTPRLFVMHGLSGSGKSWLSERLALHLGAVRIRSDVERKRLLAASSDAAHDASDPQAAYRPEMIRRTYGRLLECAASGLAGGLTVIVDATFLAAAERRRFLDLASARAVPCLILSCCADRGVLARRIEQRLESGADPSEADLRVLDEQVRRAEPLSAAEERHAIIIDTAQPEADLKACAAISAREPHTST